MALPSNPLIDAVNAAWQKEVERIMPNIERAYDNYDQIYKETIRVVAEVNEKLDQLAAIAPEKAEQITQFRQKLDELLNSVSLWTLQAKYQLTTMVS